MERLFSRGPYPWPIANPDPKLQEALDVAPDYLEFTGQTSPYSEVEMACATIILGVWEIGIRHRIRMANCAIVAIEEIKTAAVAPVSPPASRVRELAAGTYGLLHGVERNDGYFLGIHVVDCNAHAHLRQIGNRLEHLPRYANADGAHISLLHVEYYRLGGVGGKISYPIRTAHTERTEYGSGRSYFVSVTITNA